MSTAKKVDIPKLIASIRAEIKENYPKIKDKEPDFKPKESDFNAGSKKVGELIYSEDLRYLNENYALANLDLNSITTPRTGIIGKIVLKIKRKILSIVWDFFNPYFTQHRDYNANLVRYLNEVSEYVDVRDGDNFWQLIKKIDYDIEKANSRIERIADQQSAELRSIQKEVYHHISEHVIELQNQLRNSLKQQAVNTSEIDSIDSVVKGMESIIARLNPKSITDTDSNFAYLLLENRYRGKEIKIKQSQEFYVNYFKSSKLPVLDIGCGRGELLELFKENNIKAKGIDFDKAMVEHCKKKDLDVEYYDAINYLKSLEDHSLGGLIAIQLVEHLNLNQLEALLDLTVKKLVKGSKVIFETIDPRSLLALSSNYFRDPTHVFPRHPDAMQYSMQLAGIKVIETKSLSEVPKEQCLQEISSFNELSPIWQEVIQKLNYNTTKLNEFLYGFQDYCIVGEVNG